MAATGLLGINPYQKGVNLDFSSRPVALDIQLQQREAAKREALDKYFMDYEKSLTPAGMRQQDANVFLKKLAETKDFYIKNRDKILNPSKYGAEAQSQLMAGYKDVLSTINQSKYLAQNDKALIPLYIDARRNNKTIPVEVQNALDRNKLSIGDPNHVAFDPLGFDAYEKHNQDKFKKSVYSNVKPSESMPQRIEDKVNHEVYYKTISDIGKNSFSEIQNAVASELKRDRGLNDEVIAIANDQNRLNQLAQVYNNFTGGKMNPNSLLDVATAYAIALKPSAVEKFTTPREAADYARMKRMQNQITVARRKKELGLDDDFGDPVDVFLTEARSGKTFAGTEGENIEIMNLPETITRDLGKNKRPAIIGRGLGDGEYYNIVYQLDRNGVKTDLIDWTKTEKLPPSQIRASVVARALPSDTKVRLTGIGGTKTKSAGSGKETLADRMRRLKNPK